MGVALGVFCVELVAPPEPLEVVFANGATSPLYTSPSSPAAKDKVEQNPSDEEMNKVKPSLAHARSVNVAQCKLLTTHIGVFCCVSYSKTES